MISLNDFQKVARPGMRLPIVEDLPNDLMTPVALYQQFASEKYSFLLESMEGGKTWGRYSFIGLYPSVIFRSQGKQVEIQEGQKKKKYISEDPLSELKKILHEFSWSPLPDLPRFSGGAVGLVSYDMVRFFEKLPDLKRSGIGSPDLAFMIPQILLVADNLEQKLKIIYDARIRTKADVKKEYARGKKLISQVVRSLKNVKDLPQKKSGGKISWKQSLSREAHAAGIEKIREYIAAGDITQTVYSIRFQANAKLPPLALYRSLRRVNPSPYMFLLKFDDMSLVGASPETMVRLENGEMVLRPIAGTRQRGRDEAGDLRLEKELLADEKERAEHIMLVDLGRNDLGRVAASGSVHVDELMKVEHYSHVMHIVSNVRAKLAAGKDAFDVLRATFPAGTLSGSPKIRAMEIIEELEPVRRGFYGGCVGYFDFSGNMDMAITIRSAFLKDGKITVQAGGGIVADSVTELEYKEIVNKSKAVMKAVELCS